MRHWADLRSRCRLARGYASRDGRGLPYCRLSVGALVAVASWSCQSVGVDRAPEGTFPPQTAICGIESWERVVQLWCVKSASRCEARVDCCRRAGYPGTMEECEAQTTGLCRELVWDNLAAGACFVPEALHSSCERLWYQAVAECNAVEFNSTEYRRAVAAEPCDSPWTTGALRERETCSSPVQCLVPSDEYTTRCGATQGDRNFACRAYVVSEVGDRCLSSASCLAPAVCGSSGVCQPPAAVGEPCDLAVDCESRLCLRSECAEPSGRSCGERGDCGRGWTCEQGQCQPVPLATDGFCAFGAPQAGKPACHLSRILAEQLGVGASNCSSYAATERLAASCVAEAHARGVNAYFLVRPLVRAGSDQREALIYPSVGGKRVLRYTEVGEGEGVALEQVQCEFEPEGVRFRQCRFEVSAQVLCIAEEEP